MTGDGGSWFERATVNDERSARLMSWRRHPRRMLRQTFRPPRRPSPIENQPATNAEILDRLRALPIGYWTYGWEDPSVRHLGPMAQDFWESFGLGGTDRQIPMVDANGVVMASLKALIERVEELEAQVAALERSGPSGS